MNSNKKSLNNRISQPVKHIVLLTILLILFFAGRDVLDPGWGSGHWLGKLSEKWAILLATVYALIFSLAGLVFIGLYVPNRLTEAGEKLLVLRQKLGFWRWPALVLSTFFPVWFVFYSPWGELFSGISFRFLLFAISLVTLGFLLTSQKEKYLTWRPLLTAGILIGASAVFAEAFLAVNNYPFALHWSEGNRLWDYSVVFGRDRYNYFGSEPIFAWIDPGRQTLWGLPFLIPNVPIWVVRLWSAILVTIPYALLGWAAFRPLKDAREYWFLAGVWTLIFLNQGPIYTPLVLAAIAVLLSWKMSPLIYKQIGNLCAKVLTVFLVVMVQILFIYFAGQYAGMSRFTWGFAVGIWIVMLTIGGTELNQPNLTWWTWLHAAILGLAGIWSKGLPIITGIIKGLMASVPNVAEPPVDQLGGSVETLQGLQQGLTHQPFLIDRLFPNPIYPPGILLGILLATGPIILLLIYLIRKGIWKTIFFQRLVIALGLGAFLAVGVIASAKVGGGADLHNMDMFFVGLVLVAAIAWGSGFAARIANSIKQITLVLWILSGMVLISAFVPLISGKPLILPTPERTEFVLNRIQDAVSCARKYGEVLFMDQRQLITFGYMGDLPLVVDYEKKYVMDQALSGNEAYFEKFREDLASGRFSLIVSEREAILYKEPDIESIGDSLNEENNAWVTWVTTPLLQSYESVGDFKDAAIELFVPIDRDYDCP